jgi:hypothetical protein
MPRGAGTRGSKRHELVNGERGNVVTDNPYADETATNTGSTAWLDGYQKIKADFHTMSQYALNMEAAAQDLLPAAMTLYQIPTLASQAFTSMDVQTDGSADNTASPLPEGQLAHLYMATNFNDLVGMLADLHNGLQNVAYAAQTISDAYHLNDAGNARDINSLVTADGVDFAFAMGGKRPDGLSSKIGQTVFEHNLAQGTSGLDQAQANAHALTDATDPNQMGGVVSVSYEGGPGDVMAKVTTISYPDGSQIRMSTLTGWDGKTYNEYTTLSSDGKVTTQSRTTTSTSGGTKTVVTETADKNGAWHPSQTQTTTSGTYFDGPSESHTVTTKTTTNADGSTVTATTTQVPHGPTTTVTTTQHPGGPTTTNTVAVGDNDNDVSNQLGDADPMAQAKHHLSTFTGPIGQ